MPHEYRDSWSGYTETEPDDVLIRGRAELLDENDRRLIEAVLNGLEVTTLARLMGVDARRLRRRVRRLLRRLRQDDLFLAAARMVPSLKGEDKRVALLHFC